MYEYELDSNKNSGLVHFWPIWGNANDVTGDANVTNGKIIEFINDRFGNAFSAMRLNKTCHKIPDGVYVSGDFTISFWVRGYKFGIFDEILNLGPERTEQHFYISLTNSVREGNFSIGIYKDSENVSSLFTNKLLQLGKWEYLTFTLNNLTMSSYLNGVLIAEKNFDIIPSNINRTNNSIGRENNESGVYDLDEIKIFNRALDENEILLEMNKSSLPYAKKI